MQPTQLDPQAVNLAKAIRQTESGGNFVAKGKSGEYGAYQFTEPTWNAASKKYGVNVPLQQATPEQQNEVAYKQIKEWKDKGFNVGQIASMWNAGPGKPDAYLQGNAGVNQYGVKYDTAAYAKSVAEAYQKIKSGQDVGIDPNNPSSIASTQMDPTGGAPFSYNQTDSSLTSGLKAIGNLPSSAAGFAGGVLHQLNPINTVSNVAEIGTGFSDLAKQEGTGKAILDVIKGLPQAAYDTLVPQGIRSLIAGDTAGAAKAFTEDPFGQAAPVVFAAEGGAKLADRATANIQTGMNAVKGAVTGDLSPMRPAFEGAFGDAVSSTANLARPATATLSAGAGLLGTITRSAASHLTGLDPQTITQVLQNPADFSKLQQDQLTRGNLADEFGSAIDTLESRLNETGAGYEPVRQLRGTAILPENFFEEALAKFGLKLVKEEGNSMATPTYRVIADTKSATRNSSDINAVQKFVNDWGGKTELTPQEFLNMRSDLADLANYDKLTGMGKTKTSQIIADQLRQEANRTIRPQISGLRELDAQYAPLRQQFEQIKRDFLKKTPDGYEFKDGAINKIANAAGVGKDALLMRMEELMPGITKRIQLTKAVEDIERAKGIKVGAYGRAFVEGYVLSGGVGAVVAAIITNPSIAVPLLRGLGWSAERVGQVVGTLKLVAGDVNKDANKIAPSLAVSLSSLSSNRATSGQAASQ